MKMATGVASEKAEMTNQKRVEEQRLSMTDEPSA